MSTEALDAKKLWLNYASQEDGLCVKRNIKVEVLVLLINRSMITCR